MNLCEKSGVQTNVYKGLLLFKKDAKFRPLKKLFVLQAQRESFFRRRALPSQMRHGSARKGECVRRTPEKPSRHQAGTVLIWFNLGSHAIKPTCQNNPPNDCSNT
jgi:hypothetical protein